MLKSIQYINPPPLAVTTRQQSNGRRVWPQIRGTRGFPLFQSDEARHLVWNAENLRAYLIDPQAKVKGNRMPFGGVANPQEADDLVAFLESYK
jgi:hypothetical protein